MRTSKKKKKGMSVRYKGGGKTDKKVNDNEEPTYYGMLDTIEVVDQGANKPVAVSNTSQKFRDQYPFYSELTSEEQGFFTDASVIGEGVRRKARLGKDKAADMMGEFDQAARYTLRELEAITGMDSVRRFGTRPGKTLAGAGRAVEKALLGTNPMASSFVNVDITEKEAQQFGDSVVVLSEIAPIVGRAFNLSARGVKSLLRFRGAELGKVYRQVGPAGFENAIQEGKIFSRGQKEFLLNNPDFSYADDAAKQLLGKPEKGFNLTKPVTAPFFNRDKTFFPHNFTKGAGKTADSGVDYLFVSKNKIADDALIPKYRDQYRPDFSQGNTTGVLKPEYNDLSNFKMYKLGEDGQYYRMWQQELLQKLNK